MIPKRFDYFAPSNLEEAIEFLSQNRDSKVLAGGHSLIPMLKFHLIDTKCLVDLNRLNGMEYVKEIGNQIRIGALTRYATIESDGIIQSRFPALSDAVAHIGDPLVRNMGTVGGNICHCDVANDLPAVMLALDAVLIAKGPKGQRAIPIQDFLVDTFQTSLAESEVLIEIQLPFSDLKTGNAYAKLERHVGDFPIVGVASQLHIDDQGTCRRVGLGLTAVGPKALKPESAERALLGKKITDVEIQEAAGLAANEAKPVSDLRGSVEYKKEMIRIFAIRSIRAALNRAIGAKRNVAA